MESETKKILEDCKKYAEENGLKLNDSAEMLEGLAKKLLENEKKYGGRYCPCRIVKGLPETDQKNICPCVYSKEEIEKTGHCLCWLFFKK